MPSKKKNPGKSKAKPGSVEKLRKAAIAEIGARLDSIAEPLDGPTTVPVATPERVAQDAPDANVAEPVANGEAAPKGKRSRKAKEPKPPRTKRVSGLDAAAIVLAESGSPMSAKQMVEAAAAKGLWQSKSGKTPEATVYAAIIREIAAKGPDARFVKTDRGLFAARKA